MAGVKAGAEIAAVPRHRVLWLRSQAAVRDLWIGGVLLVLIVAFSIDSPYFLTRANWLNTSSTATEVLLLAVGETRSPTAPNPASAAMVTRSGGETCSSVRCSSPVSRVTYRPPALL